MYIRTGDGARTAVFLHGLAASGACWIPLVRPLHDVLDAVMPDARGHGASSDASHGYRYDDHADDALALIRGLRLDAPVLVGHSMGGMTAALVASRHPDLVRALVLIDPTFLDAPRQREVYENDAAEQHRRAIAGGKAALAASLSARHPHRSAETIALLADARLQCRVDAFDVLRPPTPDYRELMRGLPMPTLLMIADGGVISAETADELRRINPHIECERIADAGHGIPFDQPEPAAQRIRAFLERHGMAAPTR